MTELMFSGAFRSFGTTDIAVLQELRAKLRREVALKSGFEFRFGFEKQINVSLCSHIVVQAVRQHLARDDVGNCFGMFLQSHFGNVHVLQLDVGMLGQQ